MRDWGAFLLAQPPLSFEEFEAHAAGDLSTWPDVTVPNRGAPDPEKVVVWSGVDTRAVRHSALRCSGPIRGSPCKRERGRCVDRTALVKVRRHRAAAAAPPPRAFRCVPGPV
jgi:hypothetical protein